MDEIKALLEYWANDGYVNPGSLEAAHAAIVLLVAKVESLEQQINDLQ
jgi:hypothetical protein